MRRKEYVVMMLVALMAIFGIAQNAAAQLGMFDAGAANPVPRTFASELVFSGTGSTLTVTDGGVGNTDALDITFDVPTGQAVVTGGSIRLTYTLAPTAQFPSQFAALGGDVTLACGVGGATLVAPAVLMGGAGSSTFQIDFTVNTSTLDDACSFDLEVASVRFADKNAATLNVTGADRAAGTNFFGSGTDTYAQFRQSVVTTFEPNTWNVANAGVGVWLDRIDVTQNRLFFTTSGCASPRTVNMGQVGYRMDGQYNPTANTPFDPACQNAVQAQTISTASMTLTADFSAFAQSGGTVRLEDVNTCDATGALQLAANSIGATTTTWNDNINTANALFTANGVNVCGLVPSTNTMIIPETDVLVDLTPGPVAPFGPPVDGQSGALGSLVMNGSRDRLTFVNQGNAGTPFLIRLTNENETQSGQVWIDVWTDNGADAPNSPLDLADVEAVGFLMGALVAGELAPNTSVLFTAAALASAAGLTNNDIMRVRVISEVSAPTDGVGVRIQGWSNSNPTTGASFGQTLN
jgi:hypothetical protein